MTVDANGKLDNRHYRRKIMPKVLIDQQRFCNAIEALEGVVTHLRNLEMTKAEEPEDEIWVNITKNVYPAPSTPPKALQSEGLRVELRYLGEGIGVMTNKGVIIYHHQRTRYKVKSPTGVHFFFYTKQ